MATRALVDVCMDQGLSVDRDRPCVYLDVTGQSPETLHDLEGFLETYRKFQGVDPSETPIKVGPGVHCSLGGLRVDFEGRTDTGGLVIGSTRNHHSDIPGVFVVGEAANQYHGANRLSGNGLLSTLFSGLIAAPGVVDWVRSLPFGSAEDQPVSLFDNAAEPHDLRMRELLTCDGGENPYELYNELANSMTKSLAGLRDDKSIRATLEKIEELEGRYRKVTLSDSSDWLNQNLNFARAFGDMLVLARVIAKSALLRAESRGVHQKPEHEVPFPTTDGSGATRDHAEEWCRRFRENNEKWLKTSVARHTPDGPEISYEDVNTTLLPPKPRTSGRRGSELVEQAWEELDHGDRKAGP